VDSQRKSLRRQFKDQEEFKRLKWALLKNPENLTPAQKEVLRGFLWRLSSHEAAVRLTD
jgi:hypothetical protein